jgi:hydrogenase maturation protease
MPASENGMGDKILIAGIGNIFLGDDGFGVEVAQRLARRTLPGGVRVADFGIRGIDLAYALMDGYELTILVDATPRGGVPGTIYLIEPDLAQAETPDAAAAIDPHGMNPMSVFALVRSMGGQCRRVLIVGCEPEPMLDEEGRMGLSASVSAAVDAAIETIEGLMAKELATVARGDSEIRELGTVRGKS